MSYARNYYSKKSEPGFRQHQINWAKNHDWFMYMRGDEMVTRDVDGTVYVFNNFNDVKKWAGY